MKALTISVLATAAILMTLMVRPLKALAMESHCISSDTIHAVRHYMPGWGGESAIIITDRETYIAGEHVWYALNITGNATNTNWHSIAGYAEILNCRSMPVAQSRILLDDSGRGSGMLPLPDTISSGDYLVRGYTHAMIPYGPDKYFVKMIRVFNPYGSGDTYNRIITGEPVAGPALMLLAEGGIAIPGSVCRVLAKVTGADGAGMSARIVISGPDGIPCDTITTDFTGLGSALMTLPVTGKLTAVAIIDSVRMEAEISPQELFNHALSVERNHTGGVSFRVHPPTGTARAETGPLHLAAADQSGIIFYRQLVPSAKEMVIDLTSDEQGEGIGQALLYDSRGNLLSSVLFLAGDNNSPFPATDPVSFLSGEDSITVTLPGWASYAVLSAACAEEDAPDIRARSMLEPWLTASVINDPFLKPFLTGKASLSDDLLMIVSQPSPVSAGSRETRVMAETKGLAVAGTVLDLDTQQPAPEMILFINIPGKDCFLQYARSDNSGKFTFIIPPGTGTGEIVVYPQDTSANIVLKIASPFSQEYHLLHQQGTDTRQAADKTALRMSINSQVMRIYELSDADTVPRYQAAPGRGHFYGSTGLHLVLSDYIMLPDMEELFFELIPGVNLVKNRNNYEFRISDPKTGKEIRESPLIFIDGTYNTDPDVVAGLSPEQTEYIDVIPQRYRSGALLLPPVISIITKKGDFRFQKLPRSALRIKYPFADAALSFRPFEGDSSGRIPVYCNTLLWSAFPADGDIKKFRVPVPDYDSKVRFTLTVFGDSRLPASWSFLKDPERN
ncbi:MAG: hypothetical protein R2756_05615 [Bacteroidales bacterium]